MSRFLLGALAMGAFIVLTSFALSRPAQPPRGGPAWTVSQYQLDRAFRIPLAWNSSSPITISSQVPASGGFIITQIVSSSGFTLDVTVNGVTETYSGPGPLSFALNPPIVARPGDVVSIAYTSGPTIAGYTTLPGET
jgi:hypothetical protein